MRYATNLEDNQQCSRSCTKAKPFKTVQNRHVNYNNYNCICYGISNELNDVLLMLDQYQHLRSTTQEKHIMIPLKFTFSVKFIETNI